MQPDVGLLHWRDGVAAHDRMAIDAIVHALVGGEKISERGVALELRGADDEWRLGLPKEILPNLQRAPNAPDRWAGVESRANLVVAKLSSETFQPVQRWAEILVHPGWRLAAT